MAKNRLDIEERSHGYRIGWYLAEEGEFGLYLGDLKDSAEELRRQLETMDDLEDRSTIVAELASRDFDSDWDQHYGMRLWESKAKATEVLRAARASIKADAEQWKAAKESKPWPEWATTAVKAGFKPPKGWKP